MKKPVKLICGNAAYAAALVCLYSPGLIGLSPFSSNALVAAASIAVGVIAVPAFVLMNRILIRDTKPKVTLLTRDEENVYEKVIHSLESYLSNSAMKDIAASALNQVKRLEKSRSTARNLIENRFENGTLSYSKFMSVIDNAANRLLDGYVVMSNKMSIFDEDEYLYLFTDRYKNDSIPDDIQEQKKKLYADNLNAMEEILKKNEEILLKIDHLMIEISNKDFSEYEVNSATAEIDSLIKQLNYYN